MTGRCRRSSPASTRRCAGSAASPTYALTDNERTVTIDRVAGIAVKHPVLVAAGRHYGLQIHACVPADPASKGGSESTVKIAKADLVPTDANLLPAYESFAELRAACEAFCEEVNAREHRETRRPPIELLAEERQRLHPVPDEPYTVAFGLTRVVDDESTIRYGSARYSVPHQLVGERVWVRVDGEELVVAHVGPAGASEVARHRLTTPGNPAHRSRPLSGADDRSAPSAARRLRARTRRRSSSSAMARSAG